MQLLTSLFCATTMHIVRTFQIRRLEARIALLVQLQHYVGNLYILLGKVFARDLEDNVLLVVGDLLLADVLDELRHSAVFVSILCGREGDRVGLLHR